jgi:hypothetical protein
MSMTYPDLFRLRRIAGFEKNGFVRYLAQLRGINVGGKNIVSIAELRACFERLSLNDATTYIQSGNAQARPLGLKTSWRISASKMVWMKRLQVAVFCVSAGSMNEHRRVTCRTD